MANLQQLKRQLDEIQAAIAGELAKQTNDDKIQALEDAQPKVAFGSAEHAALLTTGYGFTVDEAKQIIAEREKDPHAWPFVEYQKAKAMLAAFNVKKPQNHNTKLPWRVRANSRTVRPVV